MKERPIPFSAPMVRAILAGRKTQTRRVCRDQHLPGHKPSLLECPYGQPGDRLWVREAWRVGKGYDGAPGSVFTSPTVWYGADGDLPLDRVGRYRHARFMPRWASRITLEVTGVRVERLQDISQGDALAEGAPPSHPSIDSVSREYGFADFPRSWFGQLWQSINGADSWDANPWVWVVEFRRIEQEAKAA